MKNWAEKQYKKHLRHNKLFAKSGVHQFIIVLDNLKPSYNIGKIFRSGDAFGVSEIHLIGTEYFLTQSAKGSFKWVPARFHTSFEECYSLLIEKKYSMFVLDPTAEKNIDQLVFPEKSCFIFGHEEHGISFRLEEYPAIQPMKIPQFGRVESLNVSIAASIAMYEYYRQN